MFSGLIPVQWALVHNDLYAFRADSSLVDKPDAKPVHNGLTEFGKVTKLVLDVVTC
jgi:hypothetical protein